MRNCKNPSSQVCVLKLKMEIIITKKKIENINLYSFVHLLFVSHHRIATEFCNGTCSSFASSFSTPVLTRQANMRTRALGSRLSARCGARLWCYLLILQQFIGFSIRFHPKWVWSKKTVFVLLFQKQNFVRSFFGEISYYSIVYWMAKCVPALKWLLKFYFIWSSKKYLAQRSLFLFTTLRNIRSP